MKRKQCISCNIFKLVRNFYKHKTHKDKLRSECKECTKKRVHKYYLKHKKDISRQDHQQYLKNRTKILKQHKEKYLKSKVKILKKAKIYYKLNKKIILKYKKQYRKIHIDKFKYKDRNYYIKNKNKIRSYHRKYERGRKIYDISYKLLCLLRNRINYSLRQNLKNGHSIDLLGCSIEFLRKYLESKFKKGMSWENYGRGWNGKGMKEWHVDHKIPCASFDLSKPSEQRKCFHYTNLQPLWAKENREKFNK